jgi:uncharacterized Zn finger protein (UPF0148 family)
VRKQHNTDDTHFRCPFCDSPHVYFVRLLGEFYCPDCYHIIWREDLDPQKAEAEMEKQASSATTLPRGHKKSS